MRNIETIRCGTKNKNYMHIIRFFIFCFVFVAEIQRLELRKTQMKIISLKDKTFK